MQSLMDGVAIILQSVLQVVLQPRLEHLSYEERLRELGCSVSRRNNWEGTSQCLSVSEGRVSRGWSQALLGHASQWDKRQQAEPDAQKVPPENEEELLYCAGGWALEQIALRGRVSLTESIPDLLDTILCRVLWDDPVWAGRLDQMTHWGPF